MNAQRAAAMRVPKVAAPDSTRRARDVGGAAMAIRVLLVEDNPADARLLEEILKEDPKAGVSLIHVERLADALERSRREVFDAMILDLSLPDSQGIDTVRRARAALKDFPIVVLSGLNDEETACEALQAGVQDYLVKGQVDRRGLLRAIRYAMERAQGRRALRESEERYALAVAGARDGLWDWDLASGRMYFSPRWKAMLGYGAEEIGDRAKAWFACVHPEDLRRLKADLRDHLHGRTEYFENEHRVRARDGGYRWMLSRGLALFDAAGTAYRMAGSQTDVTGRHAAEEKLLHEALHDTLTSLPNRAYLMRLLTRALARAQRTSSYRFAVLFLDLDRYKLINDSLGHPIGDDLLVVFARRLEQCLRPGDTVARLGGDEFTVFLDNAPGIVDATRIAERIMKEAATPFVIDHHEILTSASIGIVLSSVGYRRAEEMLRDADVALYQAKAKGKARYEIFDQGMRHEAMERLALETDLRRAVEINAVQVHYQPIVALATGRISGFEALARWRRGGTAVPPARFIPAAEESGLIMTMGAFILREACRQLRGWQEAGLADHTLAMSVNLSSKQLAQPDLVRCVEGILADTALSGRNLVLEITESAVIERTGTVYRNLGRLKELGVACSMDDFGTGYASLSNLRRLPIDTLKVDRSFISGGGDSGRSREMINTIVTLAHNLGMRVVAEGVEDEVSLKRLKKLKCEYAQGYYFSPAVDSVRAGRMLSAGADWRRVSG